VVDGCWGEVEAAGDHAFAEAGFREAGDFEDEALAVGIGVVVETMSSIPQE
jgi:hypothetical protein